MESDWHWWCKNYKKLLKLKKEGEKNYELWRVWWTICTTSIKEKTK